MSDFFNTQGPSANPDPGGHKANHDVNAERYHTEGVPGLWRQISDLLIAVAVITLFVFLMMWIF